jgi:putative ABC transport system permease protein
MFKNFLQDLRFGIRMLRRSPMFSVLAVLCLTLGIGANAAVFSWMEGLMFRPFPLVNHQERMVAVATVQAGDFDEGAVGGGYFGVAWPDMQDYRLNCKLFDWFIVDRVGGTTLNIGDHAERMAVSVVSANYFDALGIHPILGRGFRPEEDYGRNGHPVTVISYWLWKTKFDGDPEIIGKKQLLNGVPHTIIGVAPEGFYGTFVGFPIQFWFPVSMQETFNPGGYKLEDRGQTWIEGYARLKPGVSMDQAQQEISAVAKRLELQYPATNRGRDARVIPLWKNPFNQAGDLAPTLEIALAVTFFVLLIACANVSSLLLVRSLARRHEITVRLALGSKRGRLLQQLLTEGLILSMMGAAGGLLVAWLSRNLLVVFFPSSSVVATNLSGEIDWRVAGFSAGVCLISTLMFGLVPAFQASNIDIAVALKSESLGSTGTRRKAWMRSLMAAAQVSASFVLLVGGVLLFQSLRRLSAADPGFSTDNVLTSFFDMSGVGYDPARAKHFRDELTDRINAIPGVESAAWVKIKPISYAAFFSAPITIDTYRPGPDERPVAEYNLISPGYLKTMGIPVLSGRECTRNDVATTFPAVVVTQKLVNKYWNGVDPVGKRIQVNDKWMRVVGVAKDTKYYNFSEATKNFFYLCVDQNPTSNMSLVVRTSHNAQSLTPALTRAVHALEPALGLQEVITMRQHINREALASQQIVVALLAIFGGIALLLAAVGLYGVMSYSVSQSKRELGLRMALGADAPHLFRIVMFNGLIVTIGGMVAGSIVAASLTHWIDIKTFLFRVNPRDPLAFAVAFAGLAIIAVTACFLPAWRASRTNPVQALRD